MRKHAFDELYINELNYWLVAVESKNLVILMCSCLHDQVKVYEDSLCLSTEK